ncbi:MAG: hypothetical protein WC657_06455 [Candidatus Paceibacterota bacterium]|jgi:hypothetical protein
MKKETVEVPKEWLQDLMKLGDIVNTTQDEQRGLVATATLLGFVRSAKWFFNQSV